MSTQALSPGISRGTRIQAESTSGFEPGEPLVSHTTRGSQDAGLPRYSPRYALRISGLSSSALPGPAITTSPVSST